MSAARELTTTSTTSRMTPERPTHKPESPPHTSLIFIQTRFPECVCVCECASLRVVSDFAQVDSAVTLWLCGHGRVTGRRTKTNHPINRNRKTCINVGTSPFFLFVCDTVCDALVWGVCGGRFPCVHADLKAARQRQRNSGQREHTLAPTPTHKISRDTQQ